MGYVEMIKLTDRGRIAVILDDDEIRQERALQCDTCNRFRPESKIFTKYFDDGEWYQECDECRQ
jgi:Pyruvate/2-oxoacid:ferredoxin oxidoreductase delta subunit